MNKFFRKYRIYIVVLLLFVIYFVVFSIISGRIKSEDEKFATIIVDGIGIWEYKDREWRSVLDSDFDDTDVKYKIFSRDSYIGDYTVKVNSLKLFAFDDDYNSLQYDGSILGVRSSYDINVIPFTYDSINGSDEVVLSSVVSKYFSYQAHPKKIMVDIDNNNIEDILYIIDYYNDVDKLFSEIYLYKNNVDLISVLDYTGAYYNYYDVSYILDIDNDGMNEIIISSNYYGNISYKVFKIDGKKVKLFLE